ncbi:DUF5641 domain-containing protein [Nephila pilipes]|uniref:DUF5641 domain-containing protein n=1 Tax=Nephila pilipes TaxID=299642 RepID=A0A8X6UV75_NEPPI|nr:DUF5641 domain-containing protein [Nephila pilipes]
MQVAGRAPDFSKHTLALLRAVDDYIRVKFREDLQKRFGLEYLGYLKQNTKTISRSHGVTVGEVVLIENKNLKRLCWPLGKITETFPGKDGIARLAKVRTASGEILRPKQHLYSLEINAVSGDSLRYNIKLIDKQEQVPKLRKWTRQVG